MIGETTHRSFIGQNWNSIFVTVLLHRKFGTLSIYFGIMSIFFRNFINIFQNNVILAVTRLELI